MVEKIRFYLPAKSFKLSVVLTGKMLYLCLSTRNEFQELNFLVKLEIAQRKSNVRTKTRKHKRGTFTVRKSNLTFNRDVIISACRSLFVSILFCKINVK